MSIRDIIEAASDVPEAAYGPHIEPLDKLDDALDALTAGRRERGLL
jgi:hypothetical protein